MASFYEIRNRLKGESGPEESVGVAKPTPSTNSSSGSSSFSEIRNRLKATNPGNATDGTTEQPVQFTTAGGYYTRPDFGSRSEELYNNVASLEPAYKEARTALETAQAGAQEAESNLKFWQEHVSLLKDAYTAVPSQANAEQYNKAYASYAKLYDAYSKAHSAYSAAYDMYKPLEDQINQAIKEYQAYSDFQQTQFKEWRNTIRQPEEVKHELDTVNDQLKELEKQRTSYAVNSALAAQGRLPGGLTTEDPNVKIGQLERTRALLEEEYDWSRYYQYAGIMENEDFAQKSQYASTANGLKAELHPLSGLYTETGFDDLTYDYINRNKDAYGKALVNGIADNTALLGLDTSYLKQMSNDEIAIFNYLYATQGADAAYQYTAYLTADLNARQRLENEAYWAKYAEEHPVKASAFSVLMSPMKGLSYVGQAADYAADGKIDQNAAYNKFSYTNSAIRNQVTKEIQKNEQWGEIGSFAYQTGMSMADFLMATALTGNNQAITLAVMGSGAAADTTIAAKDRGLSDYQAFTLGTIAGLAEAAMESFNMETVFDPKLFQDGLLKYILKNAASEGLEEVGTDIVNLFADILIAKDQSQWQQSIDVYMKQGKSQAAAIGMALADQAAQMGADFLGGAVSGGILSGTTAGIHVNYTNNLGKELGGLNMSAEDVQAFIDTGLESDPQTEAYQIAKKMQAKLDAGKKLSNYDLATLYQANVQAVAAERDNADTGNDEPEGLSLQTLEGNTDPAAVGTVKPGNVTQNPAFGTQNQVNGTPSAVANVGETISIAQRLRQEQNLDGGIQNVNINERTGQPATADPAARGIAQSGTNLPDGIQQRNVGSRAGEQAGGLAGRTIRDAATVDWRRATADRQNRIGHLRLEKVSSIDLGLQSGTETKNVQVVPQEHWDADMTELADRVREETGKNVTFVMGQIQVRSGERGVSYVNGVFTGDGIIVRADNIRMPMEKIADHEAYHAKNHETDGLLNREIRRHIIETFSEEQFCTVLEKYLIALRGVYNIDDARTGEEYEEMVRQVEEEIFADAYAGINAFGAGADQFTEAVNQKMEELRVGKLRKQDNGVRETTGPPTERYSVIDETSNNEYSNLQEDLELRGEPKNMPRTAAEWSAFNRSFANKTSGMLPGEQRDLIIFTSNYVYSVSADGYMQGYAEEKIPITVKTREKIRKIKERAYGANNNGETFDRWLESIRTESGQYRGSYFVSGYGRTTESNDRLFGESREGDRTGYTSRNEENSEEFEWDGEHAPGTLIFDEGKTYRVSEDGRREEIDVSSDNTDELEGLQLPTLDDEPTRTERYSYAGEHAETADLDALERAKEMQAAGVADETIRQQTGWHVGMDGKWRWEIDDSKMAVFHEMMQGVQWEDLYRRREAWLDDILRHDSLFEAYPQLRSVKVKLVPLGLSSDSYYDFTTREILLNTNSMIAHEKILLHEIQHAIQHIEGFTPGVSADYWFEHAKGDERRTLLDLYANTAGEIEARDTAKRRNMDAEERRHTEPARADERTVFADDMLLQMNHDLSADEELQGLQLPTLDEEPIITGRYDGRSLVDDENVYSYKFLTSQPDMNVVYLPDLASVRDAEGRIDTARVVSEGMKNALTVGSERAGKIYVTNRYTDRELWVTAGSIRHGLNGATNRMLTNARLGTVVGEIVQNAIPINALHNTAEGVVGTYAMAGYATDSSGREFVAIVTVEQRGAAVAGIDVYDVTHAVSGRQKRSSRQEPAASIGGSQADTKSQGVNLIKASSKISINDLLNVVKDTYQSILSEDVLKHLGVSKNPEGHYYDRVKYSVDDSSVQQRDRQAVEAKRVSKPVAESKPIIAKRELRNTLLGFFSIPDGQRAELGSMIDGYADRLIKNGQLTEDDRKIFFDKMYNSGVMVMPADEIYSYGRDYLKNGRIYVSDSLRAEFGDDWNDVRKRAFGAGVYLTNDRNDAGTDVWNAEMADLLPGLFDSEETDQRSILERIIHVAEEGKGERMSLPEYTAQLAGIQNQSEADFLDAMERQMDYALRAFAEKASLEIYLRDRTGVKIAQEREKGSQRLTRERAREAQRRADERERRQDMTRRQRERKELQELQKKTMKQLQWLSKNRNRAPEELKAAWDDVLGDIDLYAIGAANEMRWSDKHNATWRDLAQMYKDAMQTDPNFLPSKELERIVARLDGTKIGDMDIGALQDLYKAAIGLRTEFYNRNNVINDEMNRLFAEVYTDAKREIEAAPGSFTGNKVDKFLNLDQLTPMNVLQRMGGWDPNGAFYSMAKQLELGERDMRAYSVKAQRMLRDFLTEREAWVKRADGQGKDAIWYEVEVPQLLELGMGDKPIFGPTVKVYMTPAQKVHMYLESKNVDNLRHMTGGRTFVNKELYSKGKRQEALSQGKTIRLAPETVKQLVSDLTAEEMELAQILERYYNTFATQEINRISNVLYGYDKAMGKNYAPIYTNRNYTKTEFGVFDTTAEGVGNLKGRQHAVNPSYNISAFDAFERHVDQTARFVGMAIPARNWTTLMNWREKNNSTGDVITHKWGEESKNYILDLITRLQSGDDSKRDTISAGISKLQSNYISAIFGANPSIVLKQLGSIPLAGAYLDARNVPSLAQVSGINRELIGKYTQDLEWRTMGYATPEIKHLKDNPNWTQTNKAVKFVFGGGAITAMDGWAASVLWPWAENKVRREHPELDVGTEAEINNGESAFYKKVAEEFENALSRSQSVSDEIHQGSLRKSKDVRAKALTLFRSDSAQTYNALRQKIGEARYYARTGAKENVLRRAKKAAGSVFVAMILNAAWAEAINFLMAMWKNKGKNYRDDEDELTFGSVAGEMVAGMLGSFSGVVAGGEEVFEVIGNIITGNTWYGIDTPGMEQLNDMIDVLVESGTGLRDLVAGAADILSNGGDLGEYFSKHSGDMLGSIKDLAQAAAVYLPGFPAENIEAYLLGALKWISPELGTAYDDLFSNMGKSDLSGLEGGALATRIGGILSKRRISESDETVQALAELYAAEYKEAIPSDTPSSIEINEEKQTLGAYQQQVYDTVWSDIVSGVLDDLVASRSFQRAEPEGRAKMLKSLYSYAAEKAKEELFDDYEIKSSAAKIDRLKARGISMMDYVALQGMIPAYVANNNNSYSNSEVQAAIEGVLPGLSAEKKAALWQEVTGTTSAKNNPYSQEVGQDVLDGKSKPKSSAAIEPEDEDITFEEAILRQWAGN